MLMLMRIADYFTKILEDDLKAIVKPQYVDRIPKAIKGTDKTVRTLIEANASMENLEEVLDVLGKTRHVYLKVYRLICPSQN
jgi:ATP-binding cassette subfamily E protein 1